MSSLLQNLIQKTVSDITKDFESKISEVLSNCDSPIEKVFLIMLLNKALTLVDASNFEFGLDDDTPDDDYITNVSKKRTELHWAKYTFPHEAYGGVWNYRYSSFKIPLPYAIPLLGEAERKRTQIGRELIITPQYMCSDDGIYFIDIGIVLESKYDFEPITVSDKKIAIECDGHEYHSSKEQITKDNIRARKLTRAGWSVLRFSGSEIYEDSQNELRSLVEEVFKILDIDLPS